MMGLFDTYYTQKQVYKFHPDWKPKPRNQSLHLEDVDGTKSKSYC